MKTVIEVGANYGTDTLKFLDEGYRVYAFEPTPNLVSHLKQLFSHRTNFNIIPLAVDIEHKITNFYVAGQGDWGCSSLYEFTDNIHELWQGRPDFNTTHVIQVETMRLDTFIRLMSIDDIDYLWVDAQGNDFNVLKSLGDDIVKVKAGKCEGSYTVDLYKNTDNHVDNISKWLEELGFVCRIVPDGVGKEADVHFERPTKVE